MPAETVHVLLVEDSPEDEAIIRRLLGNARYGAFRIERTDTLESTLAKLPVGRTDVVVLDLNLPDSNGIDTAERVRTAAPELPIVILTGSDDEAVAVQSLQIGVQDYLVKGELTGRLLARALRGAIERQRMRLQLADYAHHLQQNEQNLRQVLTTSTEGMLLLDPSGQVLFSNPAAARLLGGEAEQLTGTRFEHPVVVGAGVDGDVQLLELPSGRTVEARAVDSSWQKQPALLVSLHDVTEHKRNQETLQRLTEQLQRANRRLQRLADVDPLTQLLNRRGLENVLWREARRVERAGSSLVAVLVDLDDFKQVNDRLGHIVGDVALEEVARRLRDSLRPSDHLARIGGDEFLALLPDTRFAEGMQVAERLRQAVAGTPVHFGLGTTRISASVGVAIVPPAVRALDALMAQADLSLRHSKEAGKNRVSAAHVRDGQGDGVVEGCSASAAGLVDGLRRGERLRAVAQRILRLEDESLAGVEMLSRGPRGPYEMPNDFFQIGIENDLLPTLDLHCLRNCLRAGTAVDTPRLHVNVFPATIVGTPPEQLLEMLRDGRDPGTICIEISEQQFIGDAAKLHRLLQALREHGMCIAIDDVGFGRTSLETLITLEPDLVKIDGSYVAGVAEDEGKRRSLARLVEVTRHLGRELIAEGIENRADLDVLRELGVPYGQGFVWGQPKAVGP